MKKLKQIIQESKYLKREFGDKLPTLSDVMNQHQESKRQLNSDLRSEFEKSGEYKKFEKLLDKLEDKIEKSFFDFIKKQGRDKNDSTIKNTVEYIISGLFGRGI